MASASRPFLLAAAALPPLRLFYRFILPYLLGLCNAISLVRGVTPPGHPHSQKVHFYF
jgi:hypothetical protein